MVVILAFFPGHVQFPVKVNIRGELLAMLPSGFIRQALVPFGINSRYAHILITRDGISRFIAHLAANLRACGMVKTVWRPVRNEHRIFDPLLFYLFLDRLVDRRQRLINSMSMAPTMYA